MFIFFCFPLHLSFDRTQRNTPSSQFVTMKTSLTGGFSLACLTGILFFFSFPSTSCAVNKKILICYLPSVRHDDNSENPKLIFQLASATEKYALKILGSSAS